LVAVIALLAIDAGTAAAAHSSWKTVKAGVASEYYEFTWTPNGAAWIDSANDVEDETEGSIVGWDGAKNRRRVLDVTPAGRWDTGLTWYEGRLYWLRQRDSSREAGFSILSLAPDEAAPTTLYQSDAICEGQFQMAAGRMIWTAWLPGHKEWALYSMSLGDTGPEVIARFPGTDEDDFSSADIVLSSNLLAWAELLSGDDAFGKETVQVRALDAGGGLGKTVTLDAGNTYGAFSLRASGRRLAWTSEDGTGTCVRTWLEGERSPVRIPGSSVRHDPHDGAAIDVGTSEVCVAWTMRRGSGSRVVEHQLKVWMPDSPTPATLATYKARPDGTDVSEPVVTGSRVVWLVGDHQDDGESDEHDAAGPDATIMTWTPADGSPRALARHLPVFVYSDTLVADGSRISVGGESDDYMTQAIYVVATRDAFSQAGSKRADRASAATVATPVEPPQAPESTSLGSQGPVRAWVLGGVAAGLMLMVTILGVRRRRREPGDEV
jgi:hypothetical protein